MSGVEQSRSKGEGTVEWSGVEWCGVWMGVEWDEEVWSGVQ